MSDGAASGKTLSEGQGGTGGGDEAEAQQAEPSSEGANGGAHSGAPGTEGRSPWRPDADISADEAEALSTQFRGAWEAEEFEEESSDESAPSGSEREAARVDPFASTGFSQPPPAFTAPVQGEPERRDADISAKLPTARSDRRIVIAAGLGLLALVGFLATRMFSGSDVPDATDAEPGGAVQGTPSVEAAVKNTRVEEPPVSKAIAPTAAPAPSTPPTPTPPPPIAPTGPAAAHPAQTTPAVAAPRAPAPEPRAQPAPPTSSRRIVRVRVSTSPSHARLTMDGTPIANPFDARLNRSGSHRLEAAASGYNPARESVSFDRDRDITLRLTRLETPGRRRSETSSRSRARTKTRTTPTESRSRGAGFVVDNPY